ncbi:unnamed protein product [Effrenium voratum]|nr:unnamed protein product [Effrenium voratum]
MSRSRSRERSGSVHVHLPSGRGCVVSLWELRFGDGAAAARRAATPLQRQFLQLAAHGRALDLDSPLLRTGVRDGDTVQAVVQRVQLAYDIWCYAEDDNVYPQIPNGQKFTAGEVVTLSTLDTTPPVLTIVSAESPISTDIRIKVKLDEPGTVWCNSFQTGTGYGTPNFAAVSGGGFRGYVGFSGLSPNSPINTNVEVVVTGLAELTDYDTYCAAEDASTLPSVNYMAQADILNTAPLVGQITTLDQSPPVFTELGAKGTTENNIQITFKCNEACRGYCRVTRSDSGETSLSINRILKADYYADQLGDASASATIDVSRLEDDASLALLERATLYDVYCWSRDEAVQHSCYAQAPSASCTTYPRRNYQAQSYVDTAFGGTPPATVTNVAGLPGGKILHVRTPDITPPTIIFVEAESTQESSITVTLQLDEPGTAYCKAYTSVQTVDAALYTALTTAPLYKNTITNWNNIYKNFDITVSGLTMETKYYVYCAAEDDELVEGATTIDPAPTQRLGLEEIELRDRVHRRHESGGAMKVEVALPSGRNASLSLAPEAQVSELRDLAEAALGRRFLQLAFRGEALELAKTLAQVGVGDGDTVDAIAQRVELATTGLACALYVKGTGVVTWGDPRYGADSRPVQEQLRRVQRIQASTQAFAAILDDDSVVTWGSPEAGGDSRQVLEQLTQVRQIQATSSAFAAILLDASVVTWGDPYYGGSSRHLQEQLVNVCQIQATYCAFAALRSDGSVVTWGDPGYGGDSWEVQAQLCQVRQISATQTAFAAILHDGTVVTWGKSESGGDSSQVRQQLTQVCAIHATRTAFAAIRENGTVVTWGHPQNGGDSELVQDQLRLVQQIQATDKAFAAILADASVVTWGDAHLGGDSSHVQLAHVRQLVSTWGAFAALLDGGHVVTWGRADCGGARCELSAVEITAAAAAGAFLAILENGDMVVWGKHPCGADIRQMQEEVSRFAKTTQAPV